jgi:hypothetical protein
LPNKRAACELRDNFKQVSRKRDNGGTGKANTSKSTSPSPRSVG